MAPIPARIFLDYKFQLALFCQLYLIAASLARAILALAVGDECERCPLKPKLPSLERGFLKLLLSSCEAVCPVLVQLKVRLSSTAPLPHTGQILNCDRGHPVPRPRWKTTAALALFFFEYKLELALFCQLYLITASLARAEGALIAGDERKRCPLKLKLPYI